MATLCLGLVALVSYTFSPAPWARFELVMDDGKTVIAMSCSQPGTPAKAESRAKAALAQLTAQGKALADRAAYKIHQAMQTANADGRIPTEIEDIYARLRAENDASLDQIEAEFDCIPQSLTAP